MAGVAEYGASVLQRPTMQRQWVRLPVISRVLNGGSCTLGSLSSAEEKVILEIASFAGIASTPKPSTLVTFGVEVHLPSLL